MKFKILLAAISFIPTMVMAQAQVITRTPSAGTPGTNGGSVPKPAVPPAVTGSPLPNHAAGGGDLNLGGKIQTTFLNPQMIKPGTVIKEVLRTNSVGSSLETSKTMPEEVLKPVPVDRQSSKP